MLGILSLVLVIITIVANVSLIKETSGILPKEQQQTTNDANKKVAYMTFDDGPSKNTEPLIDMLEQLDVNATFFVSGQNEEYFPLMTKAHSLGNSVAVHTFSHSYKEVYTNLDGYFNDFDKIYQLINQYCGEVPNIFRFPAGSSNTLYKKYGYDELLQEIIDEAHERGFRYFDWNIDTRDGLAASAISSQTIFDNFLKGYNELEQGVPPVVIMHDSSVGENAADGAKLIIEFLKNEGYSFDVLDNCSFDIHHKRN